MSWHRPLPPLPVVQVGAWLGAACCLLNPPEKVPTCRACWLASLLSPLVYI